MYRSASAKSYFISRYVLVVELTSSSKHSINKTHWCANFRLICGILNYKSHLIFQLQMLTHYYNMAQWIPKKVITMEFNCEAHIIKTVCWTLQYVGAICFISYTTRREMNLEIHDNVWMKITFGTELVSYLLYDNVPVLKYIDLYSS